MADMCAFGGNELVSELLWTSLEFMHIKFNGPNISIVQ